MNSKTTLGFLATLALLGFILMGASNIPQGWTWDKTSQWFSVLMKDGGGTKFVAAAPKNYSPGKTYNGVPITITSSAGSFAIQSGSTLIPYKSIDGIWFLRGNLAATFSAAGPTVTFNIPGVAYAMGNIIVTAIDYTGTGAVRFSALSGGNITVYGLTSATAVSVFFDTPLTTKPTWADAN